MNIADTKVFLAAGYDTGKEVHTIAFSQDGNILVANNRFECWCIWDISTGQFLQNLCSQHLPTSIFVSAPIVLNSSYLNLRLHMGVFSPNLKKCAYVRHDKNYIIGNEVIDISDVVTGKLLHSSLAVEKANITIQAIAFNNDGSKLAICANEMPSGTYLNGNVYLFDAESGRLDKLGGGYSPNLLDWIKFFIFIFLPTKADRSICTIWHRELRSVAFSPNGELIATGCNYGRIILWNAKRNHMLYSSTSPEGGHRDQVMSLKFSQDGGLLASSSMEGEIKIWDVPTGDLLKTIQGGNCNVLAGFHKNNNKLFSGSKDGTILCWDVATGKELVRLMTFADDEWLALTPEGYYNASPNAEKYLRVQTPQGILPIETHKFHFHRPDIIAERLSR